jgi:hypothetical protein
MPDTTEYLGHTYRVESMTVMVELHVARRMGAAMVEAVAESYRRGDTQILLPEVIAWGSLSNEDVEYIVNACMGALRRHDPKREQWAPVWVAGQPMFQDIDRPTMMHLVGEVLRLRIGPFSPEPGQKASSDVKADGGPASLAGKTT